MINRKFIMNCLLAGGLLAASSTHASIQSFDEDASRAVELYNAGQVDEAMQLLLLKAHQGVTHAQYNLAVINGLKSNDGAAYKESIFWFRKAAQSGDALAQFNLGMMLFKDTKTEANRKTRDSMMIEVVSWLERAAGNKVVRAQYNLGRLAFSKSGSFIGQDQGRVWLEQAKSGGNIRAQKLLEALIQEQALTTFALIGPSLTLRQAWRDRSALVKNNNTPVYAFPAQQKKPVQTLDSGTRVEVVGKRNDWVSVRLPNGYPSWIKSDEVLIKDGIATVYGLEGNLMVEPLQKRGVYKIGTVIKGETLTVIDQQNGWLEVVTPGRFPAWLRESQLILQSKNVDQVASIATVAESPAAGEQKKTATNKTGKKSWTGASADQATSNTRVEKIVLKTAVKVYASNNSGARVIGTLGKGDEVTGLGIEGGFTRIQSRSGFTGWVHGDLLSVDGDKGIVSGDLVRVRAKPATSADATVVALLKQGASVAVRGQRDGWFRINVDSGDTGWIKTPN